VTDCTFDGTTNGIRFKANRTTDAEMKNMTFQNLKMHNVRLPIFITSWYSSHEIPDDPVTDTQDGDQNPQWENITIRNLTASGGPDPGVVGSVYGLADAPVDGLHLYNVKIAAPHGFIVDNVKNFTIDADCEFDTLEGNTFISSGTLKNQSKPSINVTILPEGFTMTPIGSPKVPDNASQSIYDPNIKTWTVLCEGTGANGTSDQFDYFSQGTASVSTIQGELTRLELSPPAPGFDPPESQAGLMFRASNDPDSTYAAVFQTSASQVVFQTRTIQGGVPLITPASDTVPIGDTQLKLTRSGTSVSAYYSTDSGNTWNQIGSSVTVPNLDSPSATVGIAADNSVDGQIAPCAFSHLQTSP
jgi:hypothetical protein